MRRLWNRNRRRSERTAREIRAIVSTGRVRFSSTTLDLSESGVLLGAVGHPIRRNAVVELNLSLPSQKRMVRVRTRLVRTGTVDGRYVWALAFEHISSDGLAALTSFLDALPKTETLRLVSFTRRAAIVGIGAAAAGAVVASRLIRTRAAVFEDGDAARHIGRRLKDRRATLVAEVFDSEAAGLAKLEDAALESWLRDQQARDFEAGHMIDVEGYLLSRTEAALCALLV